MNHQVLKPIYLRNYIKGLDQIKSGLASDEIRLKTFFYMARYIVTNNFGKKTSDLDFDLQMVLNDEQLLSGVNTQKFINYFPITKSYNGEKYECKDYYSTIEAVRAKGDTLTDIFDFFWDYDNSLIREYIVCKMSLMSEMHKRETGNGIAEQWAEENGIKTYSLHKDNKGKEYLFDKETGKTIKVKKTKPKYLKVVK